MFPESVFCLYFLVRYPEYHISRKDMKWNRENLKQIMSLSGFTCLQQSVMNFGILVVQGIVNSFGRPLWQHLPWQSRSTRSHICRSVISKCIFRLCSSELRSRKERTYPSGDPPVSDQRDPVLHCDQLRCLCSGTAADAAVCFKTSREIIAVGVKYLRIEGLRYVGIGILFMLYGYYRAVNRLNMSVDCSRSFPFGTKSAAVLHPLKISWLGVTGIWVSIPIGWFLADAVGILNCICMQEIG